MKNHPSQKPKQALSSFSSHPAALFPKPLWTYSKVRLAFWVSGIVLGAVAITRG